MTVRGGRDVRQGIIADLCRVRLGDSCIGSTNIRQENIECIWFNTDGKSKDVERAKRAERGEAADPVTT